MSVFKFGNCYLNSTERRVLKNGKFLKLTSKTFDVLAILVKRGGEIVSKDAILGSVWNGSFVEEGNLAVHVSKLRRSLGENPNEHFIETVQGSGYRFVSAVSAVGVEEWRKNTPDRNHSHVGKFKRGQDDEFTFDSIAVLPLDNESNNTEIDYLADGLTESFINSLSHISGLKVIARNTVFRYKNKDADAKEVGATLGVATILTGRIRLIKERLTFSVELTKTADGTQLWGRQFNHPFSDIIETQEQIISAVSQQLQTEIKSVTKNHEAAAITNNPESYKFYLKGKYLFEKRTVESVYKAIECFQKSVFYDPMNIHSYAEIYECYYLLYGFDYISYEDILSKIKPLVSVIEKLNQSVDVVQSMYGGISLILEWNFKKAEQHLLNALAINSNCLVARIRYIDLLLLLERFPEVLEQLEQTTLIDPLSRLTCVRIGRTLYRMQKYENALTYLEDALVLEPESYETLAVLGGVLTELGNYPEALKNFQKSLKNQYNVEVLSMIGYVYALEGKKVEACEIIKQIESKNDNNYPIQIAKIYLALGEQEIVYDLLEQAFEQHESDLLAINTDPRWKTLRNEPRFIELCIRVGLMPRKIEINKDS
jgi:TolB-like protein/tetratricopeptide (TPR) repeat protein